MMQLSPFHLALVGLLQLLQLIGSAAGSHSVFLFQGDGHEASVVDATGCRITYVLRCTDSASCTPGFYSTVTQNGASSYTMLYTTVSTPTGSASGSLYTGVGSESCKLYGTTVAACSDSWAVNLGTFTISTTSSFIISQTADMGYAQVPITAGPAAASASVLSCSISGNSVKNVPSSSAATSHRGGSTTRGGPTGKSSGSGSGSPTPPPSPGLSTGAKIGIGVGVGVFVLALLGLGGLFLIRRHIAKKVRQAAALPPPMASEKTDAMTPDDGVGRMNELYQPVQKVEMPNGRETQELDANAASEPWKGGWNPSYELP